MSADPLNLAREVQSAFAEESALYEKQGGNHSSDGDGYYGAWVGKWRDNANRARRWAPILAAEVIRLSAQREAAAGDYRQAGGILQGVGSDELPESIIGRSREPASVPPKSDEEGLADG
jgi:hypothetical protein